MHTGISAHLARAVAKKHHLRLPAREPLKTRLTRPETTDPDNPKWWIRELFDERGATPTALTTASVGQPSQK
jgi:hypothetical protein